MSARSARRPLPALIFLIALAVLAILVWVRVSQRDSSAESGSSLPVCSSAGANALPANGSITLNVLNGTQKTGLAANTMDAFAAVGFVQGKDPDDAPSPVDGVGTIAAGPNGAAAAKVLQFYLPGATVSTDPSLTGNTVTVTVGAQFSAIADAAAVQQAMAQAKVSQAPAPAASSTGSSSAGTGGSGSPSATPSPTCRSSSA